MRRKQGEWLRVRGLWTQACTFVNFRRLNRAKFKITPFAAPVIKTPIGTNRTWLDRSIRGIRSTEMHRCANQILLLFHCYSLSDFHVLADKLVPLSSHPLEGMKFGMSICLSSTVRKPTCPRANICLRSSNSFLCRSVIPRRPASIPILFLPVVTPAPPESIFDLNFRSRSLSSTSNLLHSFEISDSLSFTSLPWLSILIFFCGLNPAPNPWVELLVSLIQFLIILLIFRSNMV